MQDILSIDAAASNTDYTRPGRAESEEKQGCGAQDSRPGQSV